MVHRNILSARSPVFASLLAQLESGIKEKTTEKLENIQVSLRILEIWLHKGENRYGSFFIESHTHISFKCKLVPFRFVFAS